MKFPLSRWSLYCLPAFCLAAAGQEGRSGTPQPGTLAVAEPRTGIRMIALQEQASPVLKLLLPGQAETSRGIEIDFPEHTTGRTRATQEVKQLYFRQSGLCSDQRKPGPLYTWKREGRALGYQMELKENVTMDASAELERDGVRMHYRFSNRSDVDYEYFQAVTCVKLYDAFADNFLERTYVHHRDGFDLLASETPERLRMSREQWLPCRYLVSYTWEVPPRERRIETVEGIRRYNKSRPVDQPVLATRSQDGKWIAATCTRETGNLWSNPELTCQHADPATELKPGETRQVELKLFLFQGTLEQLLDRVKKEW